MRTVKELRQAFSKGSILISKRGVFVIYHRPLDSKRWITQSLEGDYKATFEDLLDNADRFKIATHIGSGSEFGFLNDSVVDGEFDDVIFPRLEEELSIQEIRERARGIPPDPERIKAVRQMLKDAFGGRDLSDDDDVAEGLSNWLLALAERDHPKVVPIQQLRTWGTLERYAREFYQDFPKIGTMEFEPPTAYEPSGSVTFNIISNKNEEFLFSQKAKDLFYKMLYTADSICIESGLSESEVYLNITFFT